MTGDYEYTPERAVARIVASLHLMVVPDPNGHAICLAGTLDDFDAELFVEWWASENPGEKIATLTDPTSN